MIVKMKATKRVETAISYISSELKATLRVAINLNQAEDFTLQMERMERLWGKNKENGRQGYHLKFCFDPKDDVKNGGKLTDQLAMKVAVRIINEAFPNHQAVLAVHNDTPNKHVHAVVSAVNMMTGKKLNMRMGAYRRLKDRANEISAEYGLSTIDWREAVRIKRRSERQRELPEELCFAERGMYQRGKNSWKWELRNVIDEATVGSKSMDEFKEKLAQKNVILTRCSADVISYKYGEHRAVRGDTLGGDYTMAAIQSALQHYSSWPNFPVSEEDRQLYRTWGKLSGVRRSEIDAICDEIHQATWNQKQDVWAEYKLIKDNFWNDYKRRKARLQKEMDDAYNRRRLLKEAEWLLSPYNRKRCLAGIIFAAVIRHQNGNRKQVEREINTLRDMQAQLRQESRYFKSLSDDALQILRQKGLALDTYLELVRQMQDAAEGMFEQPTEEMAMLWQIEQKARIKKPPLDEYLKACAEEQDTYIAHEEQKNEKEKE